MIAGGLFVIEKRRFEETGKYDADMDIWGGENFGTLIRSNLLIVLTVYFHSRDFVQDMDVWWLNGNHPVFPCWTCIQEEPSLHISPGQCYDLHQVRRWSACDAYTVPLPNRNTVRTAEVWMDDYKKYYYAARPSAKDKPYGEYVGGEFFPPSRMVCVCVSARVYLLVVCCHGCKLCLLRCTIISVAQTAKSTFSTKFHCSCSSTCVHF